MKAMVSLSEAQPFKEAWRFGKMMSQRCLLLLQRQPLTRHDLCSNRLVRNPDKTPKGPEWFKVVDTVLKLRPKQAISQYMACAGYYEKFWEWVFLSAHARLEAVLHLIMPSTKTCTAKPHTNGPLHHGSPAKSSQQPLPKWFD